MKIVVRLFDLQMHNTDAGMCARTSVNDTNFVQIKHTRIPSYNDTAARCTGMYRLRCTVY